MDDDHCARFVDDFTGGEKIKSKHGTDPYLLWLSLAFMLAEAEQMHNRYIKGACMVLTVVPLM